MPSITKIIIVVLTAFSSIASAQDTAANTPESKRALAKELANPLATIIQLPVEYDYYQNAGPDKKGTVQTALLRPVIPINITSDINYVIRPVVTLETVGNGSGGSSTGMGVTMIESFFSPVSSSNFVWGVGPTLQLPSSDPKFGSKQTGAGLSAMAMYRPGEWSTGILGYQTLSLGGSNEGGTANNTYFQPFVAYTTRTATTVQLVAQATFNNDAKTASIPVYLLFAQLIKFGDLPVNFTLGPAYYASSVPNGPSGWGGRASISFIIRK